MSRCHILVESVYSLSPRHLPVLFVHVVGARPRIIANPDAEVFDRGWTSLMNLFVSSFLACAASPRC